ncbi:MAG: SDR family NAD(P)-dependent oxidoreductase [Paracoccaceae bacterium]|jgi:NADP-dependent 3-hydroxy acid dehydrogenase YdfG|nr:SDR family NAD(P)-dependent oxidoreductase [Paracoccaceae bacterium]
MADLTGKIALVTGASRGLGYASAKALAAEGAHVIALARTVGGLEELDDEIKQASGEATLVPLDINDDPGLERLGGAIHQRWGKLDLWLHTAAEPAPLSPAQHAAAKDVEKAMKTNALATQRLIRVLDPLLRAAEAGEAIFCADPDAPHGKFNAAYGASKAAQAAIVASWAEECANTKLKIWSIAPTAMPTALRARFHPGENQTALRTTMDVAAALLDAQSTAQHGALIHI